MLLKEHGWVIKERVICDGGNISTMCLPILPLTLVKLLCLMMP